MATNKTPTNKTPTKKTFTKETFTKKIFTKKTSTPETELPPITLIELDEGRELAAKCMGVFENPDRTQSMRSAQARDELVAEFDAANEALEEAWEKAREALSAALIAQTKLSAMEADIAIKFPKTDPSSTLRIHIPSNRILCVTRKMLTRAAGNLP